MLDMGFRETMRKANPASEILERIATKDFKICGCDVKKGDWIINVLLQFQPEYFNQPYKFIPERFEKEARKRIPLMKQIPFSHGQRAWIGKYFGEMMMKLIVVELIQNFKFEVEEGSKMKLGFNPIYGVANPDLILSLRE